MTSFICEQNKQSKFHTYIKPFITGLIIAITGITLIYIAMALMIGLYELLLTIHYITPIAIRTGFFVLISVSIGITALIKWHPRRDDDQAVRLFAVLGGIIFFPIMIIGNEYPELAITIASIYGLLICIVIIIAIILAVTWVIYTIGQKAINFYCKKQNENTEEENTLQKVN